MQTLSELAAKAPLLQAPAVRCLGALGKAFLEQSLKDTIAAYLIKDFHRRTGGSYGPLGIPQRAATRMNDGTYSQDYQLGTVNLTDIQSQPSAEIYYTANVSLAALKCFGTYSNNNTDSAYAVISVYSVNPNNQGKDALVTSYVTPVQDVSPGDVFDQNSTITGAFGNVAQVGGSGINIHVAIWDNEKGDPNQVRDQIHSSLNDAVKAAEVAIAADAGSYGPVFAIAIDEIWNSGFFQGIVNAIARFFANFFADNLIDQFQYAVYPEDLRSWADPNKFQASIRPSPDVPGVELNYPKNPQDEDLFSGDGGSYKAYFLISSNTIATPVLANISP